ncbi:kinase-like protein [Gigaspora margarita]|uniref:Kinase-like protein n=1 Tax=Gigaspora margarita TaxID=4874 RepID=A0A8H3WVH0_GIGMA|nr:kinase-like protein [Gigaspora margarita]
MIYSEEWLQNAIQEGYFKSYEYSEFSVHKPISGGGFGLIYEAKWKDCELAIALKQINIIPTDEKTVHSLVKELKNIQKVCNRHPNIIKFYGVTRDRGFYNMILQLANNGDLREYLKTNFSKLKWTDKLQMAREISDGLEFLHKNDIIHRDLHSKNILVHDEKIFGVILWEISSGRPPFQSLPKTPFGIIFHVSKGGREKPVEGTPDSYIQLYIRCWNYDPNQRPELEEIQESLLVLSGKENFGIEIIPDIPLPTNSRKEKRRKMEFTNNDCEEILVPLTAEQKYEDLVHTQFSTFLFSGSFF